jgi:hypothetical protein
MFGRRKSRCFGTHFSDDPLCRFPVPVRVSLPTAAPHPDAGLETRHLLVQLADLLLDQL